MDLIDFKQPIKLFHPKPIGEYHFIQGVLIKECDCIIAYNSDGVLEKFCRTDHTWSPLLSSPMAGHLITDGIFAGSIMVNDPVKGWYRQPVVKPEFNVAQVNSLVGAVQMLADFGIIHRWEGFVKLVCDGEVALDEGVQHLLVGEGLRSEFILGFMKEITYS